MTIARLVFGFECLVVDQSFNWEHQVLFKLLC